MQQFNTNAQALLRAPASAGENEFSLRAAKAIFEAEAAILKANRLADVAAEYAIDGWAEQERAHARLARAATALARS